MGAPVTVPMGQRRTIKLAGLIPAGVFETDLVILPKTANATTAYFSRAGLPPSGVWIHNYVSFDGGATWAYAGGMKIDGGVYTNRFGQVVTEATRPVEGIPDEKGQARLHKVVIEATEAHDIAVGFKADIVNAKAVQAARIASVQ